jgi:thiamine-phosphate diphosphorylase
MARAAWGGAAVFPRLWLIADRGQQPDDDPLSERFRAILDVAPSGSLGVIERDHTGSSDRHRLRRLGWLARLLGLAGVPLWVNRRADLALAVGAAGVTCMGASLQVSTMARHFPTLGRAASCHSPEEAAKAAEAGASFILAAPVFDPTSKPRERPPLGPGGLAALVAAAGSTPVVALGGLTPERVPDVLAVGAAGVAVLGGVLGCAAPGERTSSFLKAMMHAF